MRARIVRAVAIVLGVLTLGFAWEWNQARGYERTSGEVVRVEDVFGGSQGDDLRFTIRFRAGDAAHRFSTGRGIVEQFGRFSDLSEGDRAPVAFDPEDPSDAHLDTIFHVYPFTVTLATFAGIFLVVVLYLTARGRQR